MAEWIIKAPTLWVEDGKEDLQGVRNHHEDYREKEA